MIVFPSPSTCFHFLKSSGLLLSSPPPPPQQKNKQKNTRINAALIPVFRGHDDGGRARLRVALKASLSGTFLQTASIDFRHLPPNCEHRFPASSSKLQASLSGTFLQTLPDLVTPLKGHSLSPCSCPPTRSAPSERFGY